MVWIETPTNPMLTVVDIAQVAATAHARGAIVVVDNTFATPYLQRAAARGRRHRRALGDEVSRWPLRRRRRISSRSTTTSAPSELRFLQNAAGAVPSPFDCYLVLRGLKTLGVRMDRHCANAAAVVALLERHPAVERVHVSRARRASGARRRARGRCAASAAWCRSSPRRRAGRGRPGRAHACLHARRVARRGRVADRAPRAHDARVGSRVTARGSTMRSCASRSASRRSTTSSPTSPRPSTPLRRRRGPGHTRVTYALRTSYQRLPEPRAVRRVQAVRCSSSTWTLRPAPSAGNVPHKNPLTPILTCGAASVPVGGGGNPAAERVRPGYGNVWPARRRCFSCALTKSRFIERDEVDADLLRARGFALLMVRARAEVGLHRLDHRDRARPPFGLALRHQVEVRRASPR